MTTTAEASLRATDDMAQLEYVQQSERVMVMCDADFLKLAAQNEDHTGIVFYAQQARHIGQVVEWLSLMHSVLTPDEMRGQVQFI